MNKYDYLTWSLIAIGTLALSISIWTSSLPIMWGGFVCWLLAILFGIRDWKEDDEL